MSHFRASVLRLLPARVCSAVCICLGVIATDSACFAGQRMAVVTPQLSAELDDGTLTQLKDAQGHAMVVGSGQAQGVGLHYNVGAGMDTNPDDILKSDMTRRKDTVDYATKVTGSGSCEVGKDAQAVFGEFASLPKATAEVKYHVDGASGDLVVTPSGQCPDGDLWGVSWAIGPIPREMNIIVPTAGGKIMRWDGASGEMNADQPMGEAPLVIVEGKGYGFSVWAEDPAMTFKRIRVSKGEAGWIIRFFAINQAPFKQTTTVQSPPWRVSVYQGDWRVPARRYREWADQAFKPIPAAQQQPAWVKDIRCVFVFRSKMDFDALAKVLDPRQTLLFLPAWRQQYFDRDYPSYDKFANGALDLIKDARSHGFRVMLYTNFFQVSFDNALYPEMQQYQILKENGERRGWVNNRHVPPVRGAYINPASKKFRQEFISRMVKLIQETGADAIHLDQDFHCHNDFAGKVDGMTMPEGVMALHRELREALPEIALGGEGINELTYRYLAFAQRHVFPLMHSGIDKAKLDDFHPITSYLMAPSVKFYGWMGLPGARGQGQEFAAWREALQWWGTIPTITDERAPSTEDLLHPTGFLRMALEEAAFWQKEQVEPDMESAWPSDVCFPFKTASGERVVRTTDRKLLCGQRIISQTIHESSAVQLPGTIPGWLLYDSQKCFGLNPREWYPYFPDARDMGAPHVDHTPPATTVTATAVDNDLIVLGIPASKDTEFVECAGVDQWALVSGGDRLLPPGRTQGPLRLECGATPRQAFLLRTVPPTVELPVFLSKLTPAMLYYQDKVLVKQPPNVWVKPGPLTVQQVIRGGVVIHPPVRGETLLMYPLTLPSEPAEFQCFLGLDEKHPAAKGVKFTVSVNGVIAAERDVKLGPWQPLQVDLSRFAGQSVVLSLTTHVDGDNAHDFLMMGHAKLLLKSKAGKLTNTPATTKAVKAVK